MRVYRIVNIIEQNARFQILYYTRPIRTEKLRRISHTVVDRTHTMPNKLIKLSDLELVACHGQKT